MSHWYQVSPRRDAPGKDVYNPTEVAEDGEKSTLNSMGELYAQVLKFSIVTRYTIYVAPLALILAVPVLLAATGIIYKDARIGGENGADPRLFFIWIEISMAIEPTLHRSKS